MVLSYISAKESENLEIESENLEIESENHEVEAETESN